MKFKQLFKCRFLVNRNLKKYRFYWPFFKCNGYVMFL
jgi:hypothetical protein